MKAVAGLVKISCGEPACSTRPLFMITMRVGERQRLFLIVRDEDRGEAEPRLQQLQFDAHALAQIRVEIGQRLVEQHHARLVHQRARQRHALLLAAGQFRRRALLQIAKTHQFEHRARALGDLALGNAGDAEREADIAADRHMRPDRIRLEHHADIATLRLDKRAGGLRRTPCARRWRCGRPVGTSRPAMQRKVVVLPQPLGPSSVSVCPAARRNRCRRTACTAPNDISSCSTRTGTERIVTPEVAGRNACGHIMHWSAVGSRPDG